MAGMLRFKDEKDFEALMKRSNLRIHSNGVTRVVNRTAPRVPNDGNQSLIARRSATALDATPMGSEIEELLAGQIGTVGNLPAPIREYPFLRGRAHRLDFAWPDWTVNGMQLGVEVQGMAHRIKGKFSADLEKRALGMLQGWLILEVGGDHIRSGKAMEWLQELFKRATRRET